MGTKYDAAERIWSLSHFESCKSIWYKWNGRTVHRCVLENQQYAVLRRAIENGQVYSAALKEEDEDV